MLLKGKTAFVTGASGGIGEHLCRQLEALEVNVIRHTRQEFGDLQTHLDQTCNFVRDLAPGILINLAGSNQFSFAEDQDYEKLIHLNLTAPMRLCQTVLPVMKNRGRGHLVTVGSMTGLIPLPHLTGYVAAKAGLKAFSEALRRELDGTGVTVTHFAPRAVKTPMNSGVADIVNQRSKTTYDNPEKVASRMVDAIIRRESEVRFGMPERLFAALNFLAPAVIDKGLAKQTEIGREELKSPANTIKPTLKVVAEQE